MSADSSLPTKCRKAASVVSRAISIIAISIRSAVMIKEDIRDYSLTKEEISKHELCSLDDLCKAYNIQLAYNNKSDDTCQKLVKHILKDGFRMKKCRHIDKVKNLLPLYSSTDEILDINVYCNNCIIFLCEMDSKSSFCRGKSDQASQKC